MAQNHCIFLALIAMLLCGCVKQIEQQPIGLVERAIVERVVDGDTLLLKNGERVRLIGIDAPEKGEKCSEEAKNRLQQLVSDKAIILVKDVSERDHYGRLVRYVYSENRFVNLALVEEGLVFAFRFEPDTSFAELFQQAELKAADGNGCLWRNT